jgi:hypothetical protein
VAIVYHYADPQAFVGIIRNAALWATDFRYLNDSRELRHAWDPFVAKLRRLSSEPGEYSETYGVESRSSTTPPVVACFLRWRWSLTVFLQIYRKVSHRTRQRDKNT